MAVFAAYAAASVAPVLAYAAALVAASEASVQAYAVASEAASEAADRASAGGYMLARERENEKVWVPMLGLPAGQRAL